MNLLLAAGILTVAPAFTASAVEPSTVTVRSTVGNWVITSSQNWHGTEVPALATFYNVFEKAGGKLEHKGSFMGTLQGDEGKSWETRYDFSATSKGALRIKKTVRILRPVWGLDKTGDIFFSSTTQHQLEWSGIAFALNSAQTRVGLVRGTSDRIIPVRISGSIYSDNGNEISSATNETADIVDYSWRRQLRVRFGDGREGFVKNEAIILLER